MNRPLLVVAAVAASLILAGCTATTPAPPDPEPEEERFVARQLAAVALTVEDFGGVWRLGVDGETGDGETATGGGPGGDDGIAQGDPCAWETSWLPDPAQFYTHSWRTYTTGDGVTFAQDWITAIEPDSDPVDLLTTLRDTVAACGPVPDPSAAPDGTITLVPEIAAADLGDGSFSYRADFAHPEVGVYATGEVHTVLCGQLWLHLSYIGYDAFIERDALLATMLERAAPLGGCA